MLNEEVLDVIDKYEPAESVRREVIVQTEMYTCIKKNNKSAKYFVTRFTSAVTYFVN